MLMDINLGAFNTKDIQTFNALLSVFEGKGVTDSRFMREKIERHLHDKRVAIRLTKRVVSKEAARKRKAVVLCPDCGKIMVKEAWLGGMHLRGCSCGYSEEVL